MANVEKFKYWCNKILPLVYDDSLSYYEFLGKVYEKLNETIDAVNSNTEAVAEFDQRINEFIDAEIAAREDWEDQQERDRQSWEDQQAQKWSAFQAMFISEYDPSDVYVKGDLCSVQYKMYVAKSSTTGTFDPTKWDEIVLADYLADYVSTAAAAMQSQYDAFLSDYQRDFGVVKTVGSSTTDVISQIGITKILENIEPAANLINWTTVLNEKGIQSSTGNVVNSSGYVATDFINISSSSKVQFVGCYSVAWYDASEVYISGKLNPGEETKPADAVYCRCSINNNNVGKALICDLLDYYGGISPQLPILPTLAFRSSRNFKTFDYTTTTQITRDGCYYYTSANAPSDLPAELQGIGGCIISMLITSTSHRLYIAFDMSTNDPRMYYRVDSGAWTLPNSYMKRATSGFASDFNDLITPNRIYFFNASDISNYAHKPFSKDGVMLSLCSENYVVQIAIGNIWAGSTKIFATRTRISDLTWSEWSYEGQDSLYRGKTINWIGDSSVAGTDFDEKVCDYFGMIENDYGVGGATIAKKEGGTRHCISESYVDMTDDCDIIAVSCGSNDFQYDWTPFGSITDTTNDTFYGALNVLCLGLITKYPEKLIFFTTPLKRAQAPYTTQDSQNTYGKTLGDYVNAIKEVCARYSIPVCDVYNESLLNPSIPAQAYLFDEIGTHATATGQRIQARRVIGWLKQLT